MHLIKKSWRSSWYQRVLCYIHIWLIRQPTRVVVLSKNKDGQFSFLRILFRWNTKTFLTSEGCFWFLVLLTLMIYLRTCQMNVKLYFWVKQGTRQFSLPFVNMSFFELFTIPLHRFRTFSMFWFRVFSMYRSSTWIKSFFIDKFFSDFTSGVYILTVILDRERGD